jgi:hypothetical protein
MLIHDPRIAKLGKRPPKYDPREFKLSKYLTLPHAPPYANWGKNIAPNGWGQMGNDRYGDCVCAAIGHAILEDTSDTGGPTIQPTTAQVLQLYSTVTGNEGAAFDPQTGANDNGCVIADALNEWRKNGFIGHKLGAFAAINPRNIANIKAAISLFGTVNVGLTMPVSAQSQSTWFVSQGGDAQPGSWGGHSIILLGYNKKILYGITWGQLQYMTWQWLAAYCDEAWALLSYDWVSGSAPAPSGFNLAQLKKDLADLGR